MDQPFISFIIPVYNAELYIEAAIKAILSDDFSFELILVDDGSTDNSADICNRYAQNDDRIVFVQQQNGGASAARNTGLQKARGEYIAFLDADDLPAEAFWPKTVEALITYRPDWLGFSIQYKSSGNILAWPLSGSFTSQNELSHNLQEICIDKGQISILYNKVYRHDILKNVLFDTALAINEDFLFNMQVLSNAKSFMLMDSIGYIYNDTQSQSLSRRFRTDLLTAEQYSRCGYEQFLNSFDISAEQKQNLLNLRKTDTARLQFFILCAAGNKIKHNKRGSLLRQCLQTPGARASIQNQLSLDPNRILALPYIFCVKYDFTNLLSCYIAFKSKFVK